MDKIYITSEIYVAMAQSVLIVFLLAQIFRRRKSEMQSRELTRHLLQTQEEERKHIARELHDDFGQRLALVRMGFETAMQDDLPLKPGSARDKLHHILVEIDELSSDIQHLSHTLHSGRLQYLGLRPALKELCGQFARQHPIAIDLQTEGFTKAVSKEVELCLYRVAQEALHNIVKHSGADRAVLKLTDDGQMLHMSVSIVEGQLRIESTLGRGTVLTAHAPPVAKPESHG
jgi:signal transduction histidine kinase